MRRSLSLQHLRVLDVLLRERSLTRAAKVLDVTQPALSKTLARLRRYFDDPLFVRVSHRMEPTPKALALARPVGDVLDQMRALRGEQRSSIRVSRRVPFSSAWSTPESSSYCHHFSTA